MDVKQEMKQKTSKVIRKFIVCNNLDLSQNSVLFLRGLLRFFLCCASQVNLMYELSCIMRKPVFVITDQVQHKLGCSAKEDG